MNLALATNKVRKVRISLIASEMSKSGLDVDFVADSISMAEEYEGTYDLMELWIQESNQEERDEIVADIQDEIDDWKEMPREVIYKPKINFEDISRITKEIRRFKLELRNKIDKAGGISSLSKITGLPQPSLSRFLSSLSRPRRSYVFKIANALGLSESEIVFDWYL